MYIIIEAKAARVRVDDTTYGLAEVMTPAVRAAWAQDINRCRHVTITPDGSGLGLVEAEASAESIAFADLSALRAALLDSPAVAAGIAGKPARAIARRAAEIKTECARRILEVMSERAQLNMSAYGADLALLPSLTPEQESDVTVGRLAREWGQAMRIECRRAIADGSDPNWPPLPAGVAELAARF